MKKSNLLLLSLISLSFLLSGCFAKKGIDPFVLKAKFNGKLIEFKNAAPEPEYYNGVKRMKIRAYDSDRANYRKASYFEFELIDSTGLKNKDYYLSDFITYYLGGGAIGCFEVRFSKFSEVYGYYLGYLPISTNEFKVTIISRTTASMKGRFEGIAYRQGIPSEVIKITEGEFTIPGYGDD